MESTKRTVLQFAPSPTSLSAKVHPLVIYNICDCYVRRPDQSDRVIGTLLGSVLPDGTVDVRNSYAVPHENFSGQVAVDIDYHRNMLSSHQKVNPKEVIVGWTGSLSKQNPKTYKEVSIFRRELLHSQTASRTHEVRSFSRRVAHRFLHNPLFLTSSGLYQHKNIDDITSENFKIIPINYSAIVKHGHFYTTSTSSNSVASEQTDLTGTTDRAEDTAALLREWGCDETDISKIFERQPSLRKAEIDILQSKLEILSKLGITSKDLVRMVNCRPRFLSSRINVLFNERLEYLETVCGSREVLLKAIIRNPSLLTYDFHNKMKPVISIYESLGIYKNDFITVLLSRPTLIPRTNLDDEKIEYIRKTGVSKESKLYKHVVALFAISRIETIREKVANLEKFGYLEEEVLNLIGRSPLILTLSVDKVQRQMTFILGTLKLSATVVLRYPFLLYFNLDDVLKPRFQMACIIEDMGLVPQIKGPGLVTALRMKDKRFIAAFLTCHPKDVAKALVTSYKNAKSVRRLAESSKKNSNKGFPF